MKIILEWNQIKKKKEERENNHYSDFSNNRDSVESNQNKSDYDRVDSNQIK